MVKGTGVRLIRRKKDTPYSKKKKFNFIEQFISIKPPLF